MNVWIVNQYAVPPQDSGGTRHFGLARELITHGHKPLIIASSLHYAKRTDTRLAEGTSSRLEVIDGVPFLWIRTIGYSGNTVARLLSMIFWSLRVASATAKLGGNAPDAVIGSSPHLFGALAAERLAAKGGVPFLFEVRDIWPQSLVDLGHYSPRHPFIKMLSWIERYLYRRAARIITLLPGAYDYLAALSVPDEKVSWIPNGVDLSLVPPVRRSPVNSPLRILYAGAHGLANNLDTVLTAANLLAKDGLADQFVFELMGDGPEKEQLRQRASRESIKNVIFRDSIPKNQVYEAIQSADAGLILLKDSPVFRFGISPNKLFDYFAAGRPVLCGIRTPHNPVEAAQAGIVFSPGSPQDLVRAVKQFVSMPESKRHEMGERGRKYVEERHSFSKLGEDLSKLLEEVRGKPRDPKAQLAGSKG